jgi:hypothetical protein
MDMESDENAKPKACCAPLVFLDVFSMVQGSLTYIT